MIQTKHWIRDRMKMERVKGMFILRVFVCFIANFSS